MSDQQSLYGNQPGYGTPQPQQYPQPGQQSQPQYQQQGQPRGQQTGPPGQQQAPRGNYPAANSRSLWTDDIVRRSTFWFVSVLWTVSLAGAFLLWAVPTLAHNMSIDLKEFSGFITDANNSVYRWVIPATIALTIGRALLVMEAITTFFLDGQVWMRRLFGFLAVVGIGFALHLMGDSVASWVNGSLDGLIESIPR